MRVSLHAFGAVAAALALAAAAAPAAGAATVDVQVRDFAFRPALVQIALGDEVRWVQGGATTHTVTALASAPERFDFELSPGQEARRAFPNAGRFAYRCTIHPDMRGVVQVGPDTTAPGISGVRTIRGRKRIRVSFRLSEDAMSSLRVTRPSKPRRVVREAGPGQLAEGRHSLSVATAGLAPGRYRLDVRAVDRAGNVGSARAGGFRVDDPR